MLKQQTQGRKKKNNVNGIGFERPKSTPMTHIQLGHIFPKHLYQLWVKHSNISTYEGHLNQHTREGINEKPCAAFEITYQ